MAKHGVLLPRWEHQDGPLHNERNFIDSLLSDWTTEVSRVRADKRLTNEGQRDRLRQRRVEYIEHFDRLEALAAGRKQSQAVIRDHMTRPKGMAEDVRGEIRRLDTARFFASMDPAARIEQLQRAIERKDAETLLALQDAPGIYGELVPGYFADAVNAVLMDTYGAPHVVEEWRHVSERLPLFEAAVRDARQWIDRTTEADATTAAELEQEIATQRRLVTASEMRAERSGKPFRLTEDLTGEA
jgi:hypothetical protein